MRTLTLGSADFRLLMVAMTFVALLVVLLWSESGIDSSLMSDFPIPA